ncbi:ABC transporter permease [Agrobacterium rhizogenes]|uniref:ABC transporter permease n=1 Tax=Rhizobium TaxID=379 RepID=UPI00026EE678|nr:MULTISPECIES: ABC transporter permease [Rhizobium]KAA6483014.1 ABC transporter permease [Agrobacterium sp. ICMP 7243]OCJ02099.1 ABC transporter permease [Agrobacterium sp. 13-626]OCJ15549.1 ABC transporter permease [Agrobacterium sp. B133/95]EJK82418.1 ABC-type nitrate/sulfonate/bicarbonate transport system, permease component [Rhizobium sp. AP16]KEA09190.1 ABC transporter permease [Rhizobium rhizogenes]
MSAPQIILAADAADSANHIAAVEQKLGALELLWQSSFFRKSLLIVILAIIWEVYARHLDNPLLFPTLSDTLSALYDRFADGVLPERIWTTLKVLITGYVTGTVLAAILTVVAINTRIGTDFLETMTAMFNPLPAISLLPLALIWFGLGPASLVFVLVHSVLWAVALNTHAGFLGVSRTLRMVGANYGLTGLSYVFRILIPAAFPSILTGLKIGWAFSWRTLIAAELVFGVSSGQGGLGWFIFENRNLLDIPAVFAGLLTVIVIGLIVENLVFQTIERRTLLKWGMKE